jgi:Dolichyl-phosphate-mannose-protein mannosyltransferase
MFQVAFYVEALRSRPTLVFWLATLGQAALWFLVPVLFYYAPPSGLPQVLALAHGFPLDGRFGPPLAYWVAEIAFRLAGLAGVYALSQICLIATYWCVFALARAIVGEAHAAMAVLLMAGISVFTVPTPNFGPPLLAMALWAAALLFYWRAVFEERPRYWYAVGATAALLLLTSYTALVLLGAIVLFTAFSRRATAMIGLVETWVAAAVFIAALFAHSLWLERADISVMPALARLRDVDLAFANTSKWLWLLATLLLAHAGLAVLLVLAQFWPVIGGTHAPVIARAAVARSAATYVKVFALFPALLATVTAVLLDFRLPISAAAPLLVLSGLACIVVAGEQIKLRHQRILGFAWIGLLLVPAILVPAAILVLPWTSGTDLSIAQPANAMGRFFAESFERRTGRPLAVIGGDMDTAALVALAAASRPDVYFGDDVAGTRSITAEDIRRKGAIIVWPASETTPEPPPGIKALFPDLVTEVPQTFARPVRGRLPPLRIGWGMIRPAREAAMLPDPR